jgi:hypothetical protein
MFFCLGKKERLEDIPTEILAHPAMGSRAAKLRKSRRCQPIPIKGLSPVL